MMNIAFSYVVACLIKFCGHEPQQAEQCALVVDLAGQCTSKTWLLGTNRYNERVS
jgi:hypothetical protein